MRREENPYIRVHRMWTRTFLLIAIITNITYIFFHDPPNDKYTVMKYCTSGTANSFCHEFLNRIVSGVN